MRRFVLLGCFVVMMGLTGCGGGGSSSSSSGGTGVQTSSTVSSQGGTISVSDASSPINGFKMVIPANALSTDTAITVQTVSGTIPLPQTVIVSDGIIELLPAGQTFSKPILITIPYTGNTPPTIVSYNSSTNSYSFLPTTSIDIQNKIITVTTNHFTKFAKVLNDANETITTGFQLGVDTFKINNSPDAMAGTDAYDGACWGFAYFSQWYFKNKKATEGYLNSRYNGNEKFVVSDAYFTQSSSIKDNDNLTSLLNVPSWRDKSTFLSLYNAMQFSRTPQVLLLVDYSNLLAPARHAVLVYNIIRLSNGTWQLDVNDNRDNSRNYPLIFDGQKFQAWNGCTSSTLSTCQNHNFTVFTFVGYDANAISSSIEGIFNKYVYSISGRITQGGSGLAGTNVTLHGGLSSTATDSNGGYVFKNLANGAYSITAVKAGYNFTPSSIALAVNGANVINQNFTANVPTVTYSMNGTIHSASNSGPVLSGATVSIAGQRVTTSSTGTFSITGISSGTYPFSVSKSGYDTYTNPAYAVGSNQSGLSFYLTPTPTYSISGTIHAFSNTGAGLSGATVSIAGKSAITSSTGMFSISGIPAGTYAFSVSRFGWDTYTNPAYAVSSNHTGLNFYLNASAPFGALAINSSTMSAGLSGGFATIALANSRALQECGVVGCGIVVNYSYGTCAAYARGSSSYGYAVAETLLQATSSALGYCSQYSAGCSVMLSGCN